MRLEERQDRQEGGADKVSSADGEVCLGRTEQTRPFFVPVCCVPGPVCEHGGNSRDRGPCPHRACCPVGDKQMSKQGNFRLR